MGQRRDGQETRDHLLAAAVEVFSERGYRDAPVAEICARAEANIAAVNYHFVSKEVLYKEVWKLLMEERHKLFPAEQGLASDAPLEERLAAHIHTMLKRMTHRGRPGCVHRLHEHERSHPTGLVDDVIRQAREPSRQVLEALIEESLGPDASDEVKGFAAYSVINQCRGVMAHNDKMIRGVLGQAITGPTLERLAVHIARFSMGGMERVRHMSNQGDQG